MIASAACSVFLACNTWPSLTHQHWFTGSGCWVYMVVGWFTNRNISTRLDFIGASRKVTGLLILMSLAVWVSKLKETCSVNLQAIVNTLAILIPIQCDLVIRINISYEGNHFLLYIYIHRSHNNELITNWWEILICVNTFNANTCISSCKWVTARIKENWKIQKCGCVSSIPRFRCCK